MEYLSRVRGALAAVLLAPLSVVAEPENLKDLVNEALATNPDVLAARNVVLARGAEYKQARAGYLPTLDLNAGIGLEYSDNSTTRNRVGGSDELTRKELGVNLRQMVYDGGATKNEVARQGARQDSALARLRSVSESVAKQVAEAYVDLARFTTLKALSAESLQVHRRIEDQIELRSKAGVGRRADYDQVLARVALTEANLVAADVNLRDAQTTYQRVVGRLPNSEYAIPSTDSVDWPPSLEEALELAQSTNPVVEVADSDVRAAMAQHEVSKQGYAPRFDIEAGGNRNANIDGSPGRNNDFSAMLRMRFNLYKGGADRARMQETAYNVSEAKEIRHRSLRQLEESIRLAWAAYEATGAQLPLLENQVRASISTRDAYLKQFNIGQRTLLDVLNTENEVLRARQSVANTRADQVLAQYRVLEAMGRLLPHFAHDYKAVLDQ